MPLPSSPHCAPTTTVAGTPRSLPEARLASALRRRREAPRAGRAAATADAADDDAVPAPAGREADVGLAAQRPLGDRRVAARSAARARRIRRAAPDTPRRAPRSSSPPAPPRRAGGRSCRRCAPHGARRELELALAAARRSRRPSRAPDDQLVARAAADEPDVGVERERAAHVRLAHGVEERAPLAPGRARGSARTGTRTRVAPGEIQITVLPPRLRPLTRPPARRGAGRGRRTSRTASGTRASRSRSGRCGAWRG